VTDVLNRIKAVRRPENRPDPDLLALLGTITDLTTQRYAGRLLAGVPANRIAPAERRLRPLRVAVAGTFTAEHVEPLLRVELLRAGVEPEIHVCGFDQLLVQLSDPGSELAGFQPDLTLCLLHDQALLPRVWDPTDLPALDGSLTTRLSMIEQAVAGFAQRSASTVLLHTVALSPPEYRRVIGFEDRATLGRLWRHANSGLLDLATRYPAVHVLDFEAVLADHAGPVRDDRLYQFAGMAWTPGVELAYAREAAGFARAMSGLSKKLLVLDLDNTLWGGVVGDDGPEGIQIGGRYPGNCYTDLQRALAALRGQGVLLAVASKNEQSVVDDVLATHPEMVLRPDDFVARIANWGRKDHNIRQIVTSLNIGMDSVVFADDSPFECELVRGAIPEVTVVHLAGDPAGHLAAVLGPGYFDVPATTSTDRDRTAMYRARAGREQFAASFASAADYLTGLGLKVTVAPADEFSLPRLAQLGLRTNQFNLNPRAHSEARTREMAGSPDHLVLGFEVEDQFGREGHVGVVWLAKGEDHWLIENMVMSCRVFSRGVEQAVLSAVVAEATGAGVPSLQAFHRPGDRNKAAAKLYSAAGFRVLDETGGLIRYGLDPRTAPALKPEWITLERKESPARV
jgi:FkbH-like protein